LKVNEDVKAKIKKNALESLKLYEIGRRTNLHIYNEVLPKGQVLNAAELSVKVEQETVFVFHDCAPN